MTWTLPENPSHPALQLARLMEDMGEAILVADSSGRIIYAGMPARQVFEVWDDSLTEQPLLHWLPYLEDIATQDWMGQPSRGFEVLAPPESPVTGRHANGRDFLVSIAVCRTEIDGEVLQIYLVRDISSARRAQEQMIDAQRLVRSILHNTSEGFVLIDPSGIVLDINPALETMFGLSEFDLMESRFESHLDETARGLMADLMTKLEHGRAASIEFVLHRRDGKAVYVLFKGATLLDSHNERAGVFGLLTDITESKETARHIESLAFFDQVTGLANRVQLNDKLNQAIMLSRRHNRKFALLFLDLDHFKHVNDSLNHLIGDQVLQIVSERIMSVVRGSDVVARFGGDEFVIGLIEQNRIEDAALVAQKLLDVISEPIELDGNTLHVTTSIGISVFPDDAETVDLLIRDADLAMYQAKATGRHRYGYFTQELNDRVRYVRDLERHMRLALQRNEFTLNYQAKVDTTTWRVVGAEALLRWRSPDLGFVSPADFIPLAEETGLMLPLGGWVVQHACEQIKTWLEEKIPVVPIAVNISGVQLRHADFLPELKAQLAKTGLSSSLLELEITESMLMDDAEAAMRLLQHLRELGFALSIDDFGTGYSSFSYLTRLPLSTLKIDRSFVLNLPDQANAAAVASGIIGMAKNLTLKTVAEGVETPEQARYLKQQGCDQIQGYLFSKPLPAADFAALLLENKEFKVE